MKSALLTGAAIAFLAAGAAFAQAPASSSPPASPPPAAQSPAASTGTGAETAATGAVNASAASDFKVGAKVKDATGAEIGAISKVNPASGATAANVEIKVGAKTISLPQSALASQGGSIVSSVSKADITAKTGD